jgi:SAM-dependent methyltransferase
MPREVDLYRNYSEFSESVSAAVRAEAFGEDIGQNSWITADEYLRFADWLGLSPDSHVLEVASGSGGPSLWLARRAGCRITGVDSNEGGITTASRAAAQAGLADRAAFRRADANTRLPFDDAAFDGILCMDAMNHLPDRLSILRDWRRLLRPGRRAVFTDTVVITGPVTGEELAQRGSIGVFVFTPPGVNERLIDEAGLRLVAREDVTENAALVSGRWRAARERHRDDLIRLEGEERFAGLQTFFAVVHRLTSERRLSRIVYAAERPD